MDASAPAASLYAGLSDWRRRVADLYSQIRSAERPADAWELWRQSRDTLLAEHNQSPLDNMDRANFKGLEYFDYNPDLRFIVNVVAAETTAHLSMKLGNDGTAELAPAGRTDGLADELGAELNLYWITGYGGGLFLPFSDATSGVETYGGGRYVLDTIKGADLGQDGDGLVIDFNFAYNPSCSYSSRWVCPLAPNDNKLPRAVCAGERTLGLH